MRAGVLRFPRFYLDSAEVDFADSVAFARVNPKLKAGNASLGKEVSNTVKQHQFGAAGEYAFQKFILMRDPELPVLEGAEAGDGGYDSLMPDGRSVDVKASSPWTYSLQIFTWEKLRSDLYVKAVVRRRSAGASVEFPGYMTAEEIRRRMRQDKPKAPQQYPRGAKRWMFPTVVLHPVEDLMPAMRGFA